MTKIPDDLDPFISVDAVLALHERAKRAEAERHAAEAAVLRAADEHEALRAEAERLRASRRRLAEQAWHKGFATGMQRESQRLDPRQCDAQRVADLDTLLEESQEEDT